MPGGMPHEEGGASTALVRVTNRQPAGVSPCQQFCTKATSLSSVRVSVHSWPVMSLELQSSEYPGGTVRTKLQEWRNGQQSQLKWSAHECYRVDGCMAPEGSMNARLRVGMLLHATPGDSSL